MLSMSDTTDVPRSERRPLVERVRDAVNTVHSGSHGKRAVWARRSGLHVLLGLQGEDAFARLTPLGDTQFGLAFRSMAPEASVASPGQGIGRKEASWDPLLLVDELEQVVEHALIAEGELPG
jgi:hypothetical protein